MRLNSAGFLLKEAFSSLIRHGFMTLAAISTSAISFTVLGAFLAALFALHALSASLLSQLGVGIYMKEGTELSDTLRVRYQVEHLPGVASVSIVTKNQAWAKMKRDLGDQVPLEGVKDNPLTDELHIRMVDVDHVAPVAQAAKKIDGVADVRVMQDVVRNMQSTVSVVKTLGTGAGVLLLIATVAVIGNVIRMTVFARRREIRIMQMVGATDSFIRMPFLLEGVIYGLVGGGVAAAVVYYGGSTLIKFSHQSLPFLPMSTDAVPTQALAMGLVVVGAAIGLLGSAASVRRFLRA